MSIKPQQTTNVTTLTARQPANGINVIQQDGTETIGKGFLNPLAAHLNACWSAAKNEKERSVQERLLKCERQRRGEYDPDKLQAIRAEGGSEVYMMLTNVKCRAAASWINDVFSMAGTDTFDLEPAHEPQLPPEVKRMVVDQVRLEAQAMAFEGGVVTPEAVRDRMEAIHDRVLREMRDEAQESADRMANKMRDQIGKSNWAKELKSFVDDFVTFPTAIFKGPQLKRRKRIQWGEGYKAVTVSDIVHDFARVSPYDIYPSPGSTGPQSGYMIERHRLSASSLYDMIGTPGYDGEAIREVIQRYPQGYRNWLMGDTERDALSGKHNIWRSEDLDVLEFWGPVMGRVLKEWGVKGVLDPDRPYEINAWWIGGYVIRAVLNPDPLGLRPYEIASWEPIPNAFWGGSLPEVMSDVQRICNASARSLNNNMGISSGPQVEVTVDRLPIGEKVTQMYPWKQWQVTSDKTGGGQQAIRFFQPQSNAVELMNVYLTFAKQADEVTGIPNYVYGSSQVGGAGRTASGLGMLMDNAAKGIKQSVANIDVVVEGMSGRLYIHNMCYDSDVFAKGDFRVKAKGATGLIQREQLAVRRREFLQSTANPIDAQITGADGRAYVLKSVSESLQMDPDRVVPNVPKEFNPWITQQGMAQMAGPAQAPGGPPTEMMDAGGNPAGGMQPQALPPPG